MIIPVQFLVPKNIQTPSTEGTFVLDPHSPGISIPGVLVIPPTP